MTTIRTLPRTAQFATLSGLGTLGAAPTMQFDSQGFEIVQRAGTKTRNGPDDAGAPTANPFWNISGTIRLACADYSPAERIEQVIADLAKEGYEVGPFRLAATLQRNVRANKEGGQSLPFFCSLSNTNPNEILIRLYKKGGNPEEGKAAVQRALARLGWDLGDTGNLAVEAFRSNVTDVVEKRVAAASNFVADKAGDAAGTFCGPTGEGCQKMVRNIVLLVGGLGAAYVLTTFVAPIVSAARK